MNREVSGVPDLLVEQLHLGEISKEDERWLRQQLSPEELTRRLDALRQSERDFEASHDPADMLRAIADKRRVAQARANSGASKLGHSRYYAASGAFVALAALLFMLRPEDIRTSMPEERGVADTTRLKGIEAHLILHRRVHDDAELLGDGARAHKGDVLQLGYVAAQAKFGVIVSIDGAGTVTQHFPDAGAGTGQLEREGEQLLPHAYELDAAPAFERFFFVTSTQPFAVPAVLDAARALAAEPARARTQRLPLRGDTLDQHSLTLVKE